MEPISVMKAMILIGSPQTRAQEWEDFLDPSEQHRPEVAGGGRRRSVGVRFGGWEPGRVCSLRGWSLHEQAGPFSPVKPV